MSDSAARTSQSPPAPPVDAAPGVDPFAAAGTLPDAVLTRVIDVARELLAANVLDRSRTLSPVIGRRTTRSLDPNVKLWVYGRGGKPCRKCGAPIQARKTGVDARLTYWCGTCQKAERAG